MDGGPVRPGGAINGLQTFVPRIKAHGEGGHIVNTASMASFIASGVAGIYCTSKFAVRGLLTTASRRPL
jgi:NAD(P)-dependent dehydrogenase (short-subunit alcohol dehydrogenase family)